MPRKAFEEHAARLFGGPLRHPVFYSCPHALRFQLEPDPNAVDLPGALERAMEIYRRLPGRPTLLRLDVLTDAPRYPRTIRRRVEALCRAARIAGPCEITGVQVPIDGEESWRYTAWYWRLDDRFRPELLLRKVVQKDFSSHSLPFEAFLLDEAHDVLYHPYDDRGADVAAADARILLPLYRALNPWLLDYDRERMDEVFGELR